MTETCDAEYPPLITHVETTTATMTDNDVLTDIHTQFADRDRLPQHHRVDSGYMSARAVVAAAMDYAIDLVRPVHADMNWQARQNQVYAAAQFTIDWKNKIAVCSQEHPSTYWREHHDYTGHDVIA